MLLLYRHHATTIDCKLAILHFEVGRLADALRRLGKSRLSYDSSGCNDLLLLTITGSGQIELSSLQVRLLFT